MTCELHLEQSVAEVRDLTQLCELQQCQLDKPCKCELRVAELEAYISKLVDENKSLIDMTCQESRQVTDTSTDDVSRPVARIAQRPFSNRVRPAPIDISGSSHCDLSMASPC